MKRCTGCNETKENTIENFRAMSKKHPNLRSRCRSCESIYATMHKCKKLGIKPKPIGKNWSTITVPQHIIDFPMSLIEKSFTRIKSNA